MNANQAGGTCVTQRRYLDASEERIRRIDEAATSRRMADLEEIGLLKSALKTAEENAARNRIHWAQVEVYRLGHDAAVAKTRELERRVAALEAELADLRSAP